MFTRFIGIVGAAVLTAGAASAQDVTLRWGHYLGDSSFLQAEKDFAAAVTERTDGRVTVEITFAGGLGAGNEVLTLASRGAIDLASVVPGYYADQLLYWRAYQIPFVFESPRQAMEISAAAYQDLPYFQEELSKFGVKFLFHQPLGGYYLTGPDAHCDSVDNLAGKKIRSFGADIPKAHEAVGAVPVSVGVGDVYEALQRGAEVWGDISEADQAIIQEEATKAGQVYISNIETAEEAAGAAIIEAGGTIKPFPAEELAKWKAAAPDLLQNWVEDMTSRGMGEQANEVSAYWRAIIDAD